MTGMRFILSEEQVQKIKEWDKKNGCEDVYTDAVGTRLTYSFTPTSLGCIETVYCEVCKEKIDLTEYDW
ncbi:hypothetical protein CN918_31250 [Priestia megaterium]|nr:hypothetical protein CN918_31250 [Priestia megaterium]